MKTLNFRKKFLLWYYSNRRELPWRFNINPYNVWIAEIIFQQTRINQGIGYFERFIERFPNIENLAQSSEDEVLKMWQGLGYYSRARNLYASAKIIYSEYNGIFPSTYNEIIKLKGIGDYTAAAIASVAFNEPVPAIDGNVFRVLSRLFAVDLPVDSTEGKKQIKEIAATLIDKEHPGDFNQAVIEFGALQCTPRNPTCSDCPFNKECLAFKTQSVELFPVKSKKTKMTVRYFNYFVIDQGETIQFNKRKGKDIWKNLYDFPMIETRERISPEEFMTSTEWNVFFNYDNVTIVNISEEITHQLTHQKIIARFYFIEADKFKKIDSSCIAVDKKDIFALPVPKIIENLLNRTFIA